VYQYRVVVVRQGQILGMSEEVTVEVRSRKNAQTRT
jgi:hypothetical protein